MNSIIRYFSWLCLAFLGLAACGSIPNKGIEVGNPDLKGKILTLTPKDLPETYVLDFGEADAVEAIRILENQFENVPGALEYEENRARITATFADQTALEAVSYTHLTLPTILRV